MRVLGESWCFCNGGGKSERMKVGIFSGKSPAMARVNGGSTGFLIHRNLLLTTHASLPSAAAAEAAEIRLPNGVSASLFPHRFFITSSVLDLTIVGLDVMDGDSNASAQHVYYLKSSCSKTNLELGSIVYFLGYSEKQELAVGEGKVVIATDNLIKLSTEGVIWSPGSAGFDAHGNFAFMVCDPMKLATSPITKSSSTSSSSPSSWKRDFPMQFGIPIPIILDWLNQHWEGNLDELSKPKLPLKRLMSTGQKNELSSASFTMRRVFKPVDDENEGTPTSSNTVCRRMEHSVPSFPILNTLETDAHVSGIPAPEIYESPKMNSNPTPVGNRCNATQIQLLDINFPSRITPKPDASPVKPSRKLPAKDCCDIESTGSVNGAQNEIQSNSSPADVSEQPHEYSSEGEPTMYSAETAESRNFPSPRTIHKVGRSQSCVNYSRWGPVQRCSVARGATPEKLRSFTQSSKVYSSYGGRSNDYYSPTVSSIMKKRISLEPQSRPRQSIGHTSPRWMF